MHRTTALQHTHTSRLPTLRPDRVLGAGAGTGCAWRRGVGGARWYPLRVRLRLLEASPAFTLHSSLFIFHSSRCARFVSFASLVPSCACSLGICFLGVRFSFWSFPLWSFPLWSFPVCIGHFQHSFYAVGSCYPFSAPVLRCALLFSSVRSYVPSVSSVSQRADRPSSAPTSSLSIRRGRSFVRSSACCTCVRVCVYEPRPQGTRAGISSARSQGLETMNSVRTLYVSFGVSLRILRLRVRSSTSGRRFHAPISHSALRSFVCAAPGAFWGN